uniref:ethanolamine kinase n=1 Tax=Megaselia scalaris TaxID=36166 RepID=T1GU53_MEGSC
GGITNKLVGCFNNESNLAESDVPNNVVLVRIYGNKTDLLIDRKAETRNIKLLHTYGFAPSLFATFKNGLAYEYVPGVTLTPQSVIQPDIWKMIARRMAEMHKVSTCNNNNNNLKKTPMLWEKTQQMLNLVPDEFSDPDKHARLEKLFLPVERIRSEFEYLYSCLEKLNSPIVFAHNDLLLGNVIYTESQKSVTFIDYEYAAYNFQAFDIGNHFAEFAGVDTIDYSYYPKKEFQMEWLRVYLQHYLEKDVVDDKEVERLYVQVNQFSLASHMFWVVWALIQAQHSQLDFDFVE